MFEYPCVILAGGKSSRMGEDKSLLPFGGEKTLLEYQIKRLKPHFSSLYISLKRKKKDFNIPIILDEQSIYSPMTALAKILDFFEETYVFIISVDTPFFGEKEIGKMVPFLKYDDAVVPKIDNNVQPLCGFYHSSLAPKAKALCHEEKHAIKALLNEASTIYIPFEEKMPFTNLNDKQEYEKALCVKLP